MFVINDFYYWHVYLFIYLFVIYCFAAFTECNNLPNLLQNALRVNVNFFPTSNHFTVESLNQ